LHPLCVQCETEGATTLATVVDHKVPHRGDMKLFWNMANWQAMCKTHHDSKTATQDGAFGRAVK
jgi:5-methylcytosine-specific restriction enzyme A